MNESCFSLKPFASTALSRQLGIRGSMSLDSGMLAVNYVLTGPLTKLIIPGTADMPARRENLWEETCFEFFLACGNLKRYWEFNLSPAGHWNIYRFSSYRKGMLAEPAFESLPFSVQRRPDSFHISLEFDLTRIIPVSGQTIKAGMTAVIQPVSGRIMYWALAHPGLEPDFHLRDGFTIGLNF